ncbi:MAG: hydroxyacylglutathione hydrolase [Aquabacterium sp.]|uniref:hydroxyacylglutathione hydrolase n=1 Tax=Aquabacterium sp. TaxID=1872578 RepID=UPI003BCAAC20
MNLTALPAFTDNYIWMLDDGQQALVVDPGDATPVRDALQRMGLTLTAILVTHRHADHVGGISSLQNGQIPVYGPLSKAIPQITNIVSDGNHINWASKVFQVLGTPGHTDEHLSYFWQGQTNPVNEAPLIFVGDTLFSAGCGRVFDGRLDQLYNSLKRISALPDATRVCAAHEYTIGNLSFAQTVEPLNPEVAQALQRCIALRGESRPTLPSSIARERLINPFLRCTQPAVLASVHAHGCKDTRPEAVFEALRTWKNNF